MQDDQFAAHRDLGLMPDREHLDFGTGAMQLAHAREAHFIEVARPEIGRDGRKVPVREQRWKLSQVPSLGRLGLVVVFAPSRKFFGKDDRLCQFLHRLAMPTALITQSQVGFFFS